MPATVLRLPRAWRRRPKPRPKRREWCSYKVIRGNCLAWALRQWCRRGGYLVIRRADLSVPFCHFLWMPRHGRHAYHFRPENEQVHLPWPYLRGYIARHEDDGGP